MTQKTHCLSSMADGEAILHNGTSSNETPRSLLSNKTPGSKDPSSLDNRPPVQTNADEPGRNNKSNTHIAGAGTPSSSKPASAPICTCGQVIATSPGYVDEDGEEHDMEVYYRHCERHDPDGKDPWTIDNLGDLMKLTNTILTKEGRAYWRKLRRESDEQNPHIAEMEVVKAEIQKVDDELKFMGVAKEKIKDWNQQDQFDRAAGRERTPFPEWLERYRDIEKFYETRNQLEQKRQALMDQKFELCQSIVNWRYQINPQGGKP